MKKVFINCNIIDGKGGDIRPNLSIFVIDSKIVNIVENCKDFKGYKIIDLHNKYIMPGLINAHVHLFGTGMPSKIVGGGSLQDKVIKFINTKIGHKVADKLVESSAKQQLNSGVTTLRSMGDFVYSDVRVRDAINRGDLVGPRLIVSGPAITVTGGHGDGTMAMSADTEEDLRKLVRQNVDNKVDIIKICVTGGVMDAKKKGEPGELRMNVAQTTAVCEEAHKYGLKVASHTESEEGVNVCIQSKVDTIEHSSILDYDMIKGLKANKSAIICTLTPALMLASLSSEVTKLSPLCVYNSEVVFENMIKGAKAALNNGILVGAGTDASCPFATQYNTWREIKYISKYLNISIPKAISIMTLENAKVLGLDEKIGTIERGKEADMIVANENPYENIDTLANLFMVVVGGKIIRKPKAKKSKSLDHNIEEVEKIIDKKVKELQEKAEELEEKVN
ncbi:MAG: amidohydrolase family protein [Clostridia bacterium]